jgi:hypothetical protein
MIKKLLGSLCIITLLSTQVSQAQFDTTSASYDFEALVNGNLNLQDSWKTALYSTNVDWRLADTIVSHPSRVAFFNQSGPSVGADAYVPLVSLFPGIVFDNSASIYLLEFDVRRNYWGYTIGFGADLDNNGVIPWSTTTERPFMLNSGSLNGEKMILPNNTTYNLGNTFGTTTWRTVQIVINPTNGINGGTFSVGNKALGAPAFTNIVFNSPLYADTLSNTKTNITRWNYFFMHSEGATGMIDNIKFTKLSPITTGISDFPKESISAYFNEGIFYIRNTQNQFQELTIRIIDASGRVCYKGNSNGNDELSLSDLNNGWYCAKIYGKSRALQIPFFKH